MPSDPDLFAPPSAFSQLPTNPAPGPTSSPGEREDSETSHAQLTDTQALTLIRQEFKDLVESDLILELDLPPGQSVDRYLGDEAATIEVPGQGPDVLLESTTPLIAPEGQGEAPIDGEIVAVDGHLEPANAPVEVEIAQQLGGGIGFEKTGVEVAIEGDAAADAVEVADKVFYANAETDTDALVTPTPFGAQVAWQLRSSDSPEELALSFDLPAGGSIEVTEEGGAIARAGDGSPLLDIAAPVAYDAEGRTVDIRYEVAGSTLAVVVEHVGEDLMYPLVADPAISDYYDLHGALPLEWPWQRAVDGFTSDRQVDGITQAALPGYYFWAWNYGQWVIPSIRQSFIEQINFYNFDRYSGNPPTCTSVGIYSPVSGWWEPGHLQNEVGTEVGYGGAAVQNICDTANQGVYNNSRFAWVGNYTNPEWADYAQATTGNYGVFALVTPYAGWRGQWTAYNKLRSAWIFRYDHNNPTAAFGPGVPSSSWRDDGGGASAFPTTATDPGLGIKWITVMDGFVSSTSASVACTGMRDSVCPSSWSPTIHHTLQEGRRSVTVTAQDVIQRMTTSAPIYQRIDRTPPDIATMSGSLLDESENLLTTLDYDLTVTATDGSTATDGQMRSGVTRLELRADNQLIRGMDQETGQEVTMAVTQPADPNVGSTPMSHTFHVPALSIPAGTQRLEVWATDALGHVRKQRIEPPLTTGIPLGVRNDTQSAEVSLQATAPDSQGNITVSLEASDGAPYDDPLGRPFQSGVTEVEIYLDGQMVGDPIKQGCRKGGCSAVKNVGVNAPGGLNDHEVVAIVYDKAGNSLVKQIGKKRSGFDRFGYSGEFGRWPDFAQLPNTPPTHEGKELINRAIAGASNVLRFGITWCDISPTSGTLTFAAYETAMEHIRDYNDGVPNNQEVKVVLVLIGSPGWASGSAEACPITPPTDDAAGNAAWRTYVRNVLQKYGPQVNADYGVIGIEVWNEPNLNDFWHAPGDLTTRATRFGDLVQHAYDEVQALGIQDQLKVIPGALSPDGLDPRRFTRTALEAIDEGGAVDAIAVHLYANRRAEARGAANKLGDEYDDLMLGVTAAGYEDRPRWITEIGFPSDNHVFGAAAENSTERTQRERLEEAFYRFAWRANVTMFAVHSLYDSYAGAGSEANNFGTWRILPHGTVPQCRDGFDNDGDAPLIDGVIDDGIPDDPDCGLLGNPSPDDSWESPLAPPYTPRAVYCTVARIAAVKANPATAPECP